jgi:hypothetical protein
MSVRAEDTPRYDGWGPDQPWGCQEWIAWHRALTRIHGESRADEVWARAWLDGLSRLGGGRGTAPGSGAVFDAVPTACRTFDAEFSDYVSRRPKLRAAVWAGFGGAIVAPLAGAAGFARGAGFGVQDLGAALAGAGSQMRSSPSLVWLAAAGALALMLRRR